MAKKDLYKCPACEKILEVPRRLQGNSVTCPSCKNARMSPYAGSLQAETEQDKFIGRTCNKCGRGQVVNQSGKPWCGWCGNWAVLDEAQRNTPSDQMLDVLPPSEFFDQLAVSILATNNNAKSAKPPMQMRDTVFTLSYRAERTERGQYSTGDVHRRCRA